MSNAESFGLLPGDVWSIADREAHCLKTALERLGPFLDDQQTGDLAVWEMALAGEHSFQLTPNDWDRTFLDTLLASELERLWHDDAELPCGHQSDLHFDLLRELQRRLITLPKSYAALREPHPAG